MAGDEGWRSAYTSAACLRMDVAHSTSPGAPSTNRMSAGWSCSRDECRSVNTLTGSGRQGKSLPAGSSLTRARASSAMRAPSASTSTRVGMPCTASSAVSSCRVASSAQDTAGHGMLLAYAEKDSSLLSELTKTTSKLWPRSRTALYVATSWGVNALQGGHCTIFLLLKKK